jgi:hypothetical protein
LRQARPRSRPIFLEDATRLSSERSRAIRPQPESEDRAAHLAELLAATACPIERTFMIKMHRAGYPLTREGWIDYTWPEPPESGPPSSRTRFPRCSKTGAGSISLQQAS